MATLRLLFKRPGYALACIAILALGIGANTAIFTVLYAVILKPLPYPDSGRMVFVFENYRFFSEDFGRRMPVRRTNYNEWRQQTALFDSIGAFREADLRDERPGQPAVKSVFLSPGMFDLLGARAQLGRLFGAEEDTLGAEPVALLSDAFFETRYQRDPATVGRRIRLDGKEYTIIGVLPARFHLPAYNQGDSHPRPKVWLPLSRAWSKPEEDTQSLLEVVARMRPGVTLEQVRTELGALAKSLFAKDPARYGFGEVSVFTLPEENSSAQLGQTLALLLGAVGFLLLIGCANLANLTLARASMRSREMAVRRALGASRGAIVFQLLKESLVVSLAGAAVGLEVAHWAVAGMLAMEPPGLETPDEIYVNLTVLAFTALMSAFTAVLFGLAPAVTASRISVNAALKTGGGGGASAVRGRSRQWLIAAEVALAMTLVTGAGLMLRSFANVLRTGIGFDMDRFVAADATLPEDRYPDDASRGRFFAGWLERVRALPGVEQATFADALPMHRITNSSFEIAGRPAPAPPNFITSDYANVGAEYFRTLRLPILAGRDFTAADLDRDPKARNGVVIVNQSFAREFFPDGDPVGQRITDNGASQVWEIVGVVPDYRAAGVENPIRSQRFVPSRGSPYGMVITRTSADPASLAGALRSALAETDPQLTPGPVETMRHYFETFPDQAQRRFTTTMLTLFAALALLLAMTGIFSVMANLVASRTREIGIRLALGATPAAVGGMVLGESLRPVLVGLGVGLAGSLGLARVLGSKLNLFQVGAYDPLTLAAAAAAILLVAPLAVLVPLRRAARVSCTVALREE